MILIEKLKKLLNSGYTLQRIGDVADKSPASISRLINGSHIIDLYAALKIVKAYFSEDEAEIMVDFCKKMDRKGNRTAIEYVAINGHKDLYHQLLDKLKQSNNRVDKEWARAYEYETQLNNGQVRPFELLDRINKTKSDSVEIKIYLFILSSYCYLHLRQFDLMRTSLFEAELFIDQINDEFIRNSYNVRLGQALAVVSLSLNEIEDCRKYARLVIEHDLFYTLAGPAYHAIGHSYFLENYDQALEYLYKARDVFLTKGSANVSQVEYSIDLMRVYYGKEPEFLLRDNSDNEALLMAFHKIKKNNLNEASVILNQMNIDELTNYSKGFYYYYRGLLTNEEKYYYEAIYYFKKSGELFFRQLPCISLQQMGVSEYALKALSI